MARGRRSNRGRGQLSTGAVVLLLCIGVFLWWLDQRGEASGGSGGGGSAGVEPGVLETGGYRELQGCSLVSHRHNDGDSFHVAIPGGRTQEFRLYFVDAPESAVKHYRGGDSNEERLRFQGEYFGDLSQKETTEVGQAAKKWTAEILGRQPFTIYTRSEKVYQGPRLYCLVSVRDGGRERWLHELLVERGLARIYTKGAPLPDGTKSGVQKSRLQSLERDAKSQERGAWSR